MSNTFTPNPIRSAPALTPSTGPGSYPLQIGNITFDSNECPEDMPIGAVAQMVVAQTLPGGSRIINTYGPSPDEVSWRGKLWATNVDARIQQMRLYCVSGQTVLLSWHDEQYNVVVKNFVPHYHHVWHADYEITVVVVSDANGAFTIANGLSIDQQVNGLQIMMLDQNNIVYQFDPQGSQDIQAALPVVQTQIALAGPLATASALSVQNINAAIGTALSTVQKYTNAIGPLAPQYAATLQLASTLTTMSANVGRGQQPNSQIVQGGSLFNIAAQHFGDPTQAFALATANGLISPWLTSAQQRTIVLPPLPSTKQTN